MIYYYTLVADAAKSFPEALTRMIPSILTKQIHANAVIFN